MFVHDEPLAIFIFKDHGPPEIPHLDFSSFGCHLFRYHADGFILKDTLKPSLAAVYGMQR
jgi:hypothetical protein